MSITLDLKMLSKKDALALCVTDKRLALFAKGLGGAGMAMTYEATTLQDVWHVTCDAVAAPSWFEHRPRDKPLKPFGDIDHKLEEEPSDDDKAAFVDNARTAVVVAFHSIGEDVAPEQVLVQTSFGPVDGGEAYKLSLHVIVDAGIAFATLKDQKNFWQGVYNAGTADKTLHADLKVYTEGVWRLLGSTKPGEDRPLRSADDAQLNWATFERHSIHPAPGARRPDPGLAATGCPPGAHRAPQTA